MRARAIENLAYVIAPGQTGEHPDNRSTWGHSVIIDPWGRVLGELQEILGAAALGLRNLLIISGDPLFLFLVLYLRQYHPQGRKPNCILGFQG